VYSNPNLNILLLTPGRTGSTCILKLYSEISTITTKVRKHRDNIYPLSKNEILHSHTVSDVNLANENTIFIVSKRNLIETTYSRIIGTETQKWAYFQNEPIKPFYSTKEFFLQAYKGIYDFYDELRPLLPGHTIHVDYKDFSDDFTKLFDILQVSKMNLKFAKNKLIPVKTPGSYRDWILNFEELDEVARTLDPNPPI